MQIYIIFDIKTNKYIEKMTGFFDRLDIYMKHRGLNDNKITIDAGISNGLIGKGRKRGSISQENISKILCTYSDLSADWLLTGGGEMLKNTSDAPIVSYTAGVPYYDVDFIGGYDLIENDQTLHPAYNIDFEPYNKADSWVNITGHSMEPTINHGDIIALKRMNDWNTYLLYGEIYAIVTDEYRTVKRVRKSDLGTDYIRLVPVNDGFDEQDIRRDIIRHVYQVIGSMRRFF